MQYMCIWSENRDAIETKVQIRKPIIPFSKSKCHASPPRFHSRSTENLKTGKALLLSSHTEAKESVPSYQLLHHRIDTKKKSWEKLQFQGEFSYTSLHLEWLEDVLTRCRGWLVINHFFNALYLSFFFVYEKCLHLVRAICGYWCPEPKIFEHLEGWSLYFSTRLPWLPWASIFGISLGRSCPPSTKLKTNMRKRCNP